MEYKILKKENISAGVLLSIFLQPDGEKNGYETVLFLEKGHDYTDAEINEKVKEWIDPFVKKENEDRLREKREEEFVKNRQKILSLPILKAFVSSQEIAADGRSEVVITIQKYSAEGNPLTGAEHNDIIWVSSTAGILSKRVVQLVGGKAEVILKSCTETVDARICVLSRDESMLRSSEDRLVVRFMPLCDILEKKENL